MTFPLYHWYAEWPDRPQQGSTADENAATHAAGTPAVLKWRQGQWGCGGIGTPLSQDEKKHNRGLRPEAMRSSMQARIAFRDLSRSQLACASGGGVWHLELGCVDRYQSGACASGQHAPTSTKTSSEATLPNAEPEMEQLAMLGPWALPVCSTAVSPPEYPWFFWLTVEAPATFEKVKLERREAPARQSGQTQHGVSNALLSQHADSAQTADTRVYKPQQACCAE